MSLTYGVAALARPTFDVPFAEEMKDKAFAAFDAAGIKTIGPRTLLFDAEAAEAAVAAIKGADHIDALVLLQITFTDATMTVRLAESTDAPVAIWAVPEPRIGGRLRLNAFCGLNLAAHALGKANRAHHWLYAAPDAPQLTPSLEAFAHPTPKISTQASRIDGDDAAPDHEKGRAALSRLRGSRIQRHRRTPRRVRYL